VQSEDAVGTPPGTSALEETAAVKTTRPEPDDSTIAWTSHTLVLVVPPGMNNSTSGTDSIAYPIRFG